MINKTKQNKTTRAKNYLSDKWRALVWKYWQIGTTSLRSLSVNSTSWRNLLATISKASSGHGWNKWTSKLTDKLTNKYSGWCVWCYMCKDKNIIFPKSNLIMSSELSNKVTDFSAMVVITNIYTILLQSRCSKNDYFHPNSTSNCERQIMSKWATAQEWENINMKYKHAQANDHLKPVNGAAIDQSWELPESVSECIPNWTHA